MNQSPRLAFAAALFSMVSSTAALASALVPTSGHPALSDYVAPIALPVASGSAVVGLVAAAISRRVREQRGYRIAVTANLAAILAAWAIWYFWPYLKAG